MPAALTRRKAANAAPSGLEKLASVLNRSKADRPAYDLDGLPALSAPAAELVRDRLEAGIGEGLLKIGTDLYEQILLVLMPDDFVIGPPTGAPTRTPRGSAGRVAAYRQRAARGEALARPADGWPGRGVRVRERKCGMNRSAAARAAADRLAEVEAGPKVLGWADPEADPVPAGMYRTPAGKWFAVD